MTYKEVLFEYKGESRGAYNQVWDDYVEELIEKTKIARRKI